MVDMQRPTNTSTALARKFPEQVVIVTAKDLKGIPNPITVGWTMITSHQPPMMAISVGDQRYSHENIKRAKEFVITFPSADMAKEALFYGTRSGSKVEKIKEFGGKTEPCKKIDCVLFTNATANFECKLVGELDTGDHTLFVGQVVQAWTNTEKKERVYTLSSGFDMGSVEGKTLVKFDIGLFKK